MKTKEAEKTNWPKIEYTINKDLDKYKGQVLFPEKLKKANETVRRIGLPKKFYKKNEAK